MDVALIEKARRGDSAARSRLLSDFDGMIRSVARYYYNTSGFWSLEDLLQAGRVGFLEALNRFDPAVSPAFVPFAREGVRIAIRDFITGTMRFIRIPKCAQESAKKLTEAKKHIEEESGEAPSHEELMEATGFSERRLRNAERTWLLSVTMSLDYEYDEGSEFSQFAVSSDDISDCVVDNLMTERLSALMDTLTWDDRFIVNSFYGSFGVPKLKISEIAERLSISVTAVRKRVRRIENSLYRMIS